MSELQPRDLDARLASLEYTGAQSVAEAAELRQAMAAVVDLVRRAGMDARERLWAVREAERKLGSMILAAREAGDIARRGQPRSNLDAIEVTQLGITHDLAAHAVQLAAIPGDVWEHWRGMDAEPTQRAVKNAAREYADQLARVERTGEHQRAEQRRLRAQRERVEAELRALAEQQRPTVEVPPLRPEETSLAGAQIAAMAAAPEPPPQTAAADDRRAETWTRELHKWQRLLSELDGPPPALPADTMADLTVLAARDVARRITDAAAVWLRAVNTQYEGLIGRD